MESEKAISGAGVSVSEFQAVSGSLAVQSAKKGTNDRNQSLSWGRPAAAGQTTGSSQAKPLEKAQRNCGVALCLDQAGDGISEMDGSGPARDENSMGSAVHGGESAQALPALESGKTLSFTLNAGEPLSWT